MLVDNGLYVSIIVQYARLSCSIIVTTAVQTGPAIHPSWPPQSSLWPSATDLAPRSLDTTGISRSAVHRDVSDFYQYSFQYWSFHYREEQHQNHALNGRVHYFLWRDLSIMKPGQPARHESPVGACSVYCLECLKCTKAYCSQRGLDCLGEMYSRLSRGSKRRSKMLNSNEAGASRQFLSVLRHTADGIIIR